MVRSAAKSTIALACLLTTGSYLHAQRCAVCSKNGIDMPVSLAVGTVRTPEFPVKGKYYNIEIEAKWLIPDEELRCKMGFAVSPSDNHCDLKHLESLLEIKWRVLDGGQVVAEGSDEGRSTSFEADSKALTRDLGTFKAVNKHRYVVEVTFIKDASALNVTQPRLIVETPGFSF